MMLLVVVGGVFAVIQISNWFRGTQMQKIYGSNEVTPTVTQQQREVSSLRPWQSADITKEPEIVIMGTSVIPAKIVVTITERPSATPLPTGTTIPTNTPLPTLTPMLTFTPMPTIRHVVPTTLPRAPTYTPYPTYTPIPTFTDVPTLSPTPTATDVPQMTVTPNPNQTFKIYLPLVGCGVVRSAVPSDTPQGTPYP